MASIRKRGDKWQVQVRRYGRSPVSRTFIKRSDADEWARHMDSQADRGDLPANRQELSRYTLGDILRRYMEEVVPDKRGKREGHKIKVLLRHSIAEISLDRLREADLCAWRDERLKLVKPASFLRDFAIIQHALRLAKNEWGIGLRENPADRVRKPKICNARTRRLTPDEATSLLTTLRASSNYALKAIVTLAIETGMRRGEMLAIRRSHVDFDKRVLFIPQTKNGFSRTIALSSTAFNVLVTLANNGADYLLPHSGNAIRLAWERLKKRAGLEDLRFHDLRHEAISRLFERGLSIPEVALMSGHRDTRMLMRYTHLRPEDVALKLAA